MPSPTIIEGPANTRFDDENWYEFIQTVQPGGGDTFTRRASDAVLVGVIDAARAMNAVRYFTGYATADTVDPYRMYRKNPPRHPRFPWMYASGISFQQFGPRGNTDNPDNEPYIDALAPDEPITRAAKYDKCFATVRWTQYPYTFLTDAQLIDDFGGREYERNTIFFEGLQPNFSMLQASGVGYLRWAETGPGGPNTNPASAENVFPAPLGVPQCKMGLSIRWVDVPDEFVFGSSYKPEKILAGLGMVNSSTFLDYSAGTLWLSAVNFERHTSPLYVDQLVPATEWDLVFHMEFFDPTKGASSNYRGHNLMPYSTNGLYYYCTRDGTTGGQPYLGSYDFKKLFTQAQAP